MLDWFLPWMAAAVLSAVACALWRAPAHRLGFLDYPGERSLHSEAKLRAGGLPMALAVLLCLLIWQWWMPGLITMPLTLALAFAGILALVATVDDRWPMPIGPRLSIYLLFCFIIVLALRGDLPAPGLWLWLPLFTLGLAWMTNLYNFMDGSDGLAGVQGVIGFATLAGLAVLNWMPGLALACLIISGACAGFLVWNRPPARLFMGDAGSIPLGFLAGSLGLILYLEAGVAPWLVLLPFAPFWLDASVTLLRRMVKGEAFWRPHRSHYYQRLVQSGFGHAGTLAVYALLMLLCSAAALMASQWSGWLPGLLLSLATLSALLMVGAWIHKRS